MSKPDYLISTPENVDLHLELAGMGNRIFACLIDTLLSYAMLLLLGLACTLFLGLLEAVPMAERLRTIIDYCVLGLAIFLVLAVIFGYYIFFEGTWHGQTPGKKVARIRVIEQNGQPVSWPAVIIRNLVRAADTAVLLIGLLVVMIDRNERRLGDLAAGTLVIREVAEAPLVPVDQHHQQANQQDGGIGRPHQIANDHRRPADRLTILLDYPYPRHLLARGLAMPGFLEKNVVAENHGEDQENGQAEDAVVDYGPQALGHRHRLQQSQKKGAGQAEEQKHGIAEQGVDQAGEYAVAHARQLEV